MRSMCIWLMMLLLMTGLGLRRVCQVCDFCLYGFCLLSLMVMHEEPDGYKSSTSLASPSPSLYSQSSPSQSLSPPPSFMGMGSSQPVGPPLSHPLLSGPIKFLSAHTNDPVVRWAQK